MGETESKGRLIIPEKKYFETVEEIVKENLDNKEKEFFDKHSERYVGLMGKATQYGIAGSELLAKKAISIVIGSVKDDYKKEHAQE
jgi:hypothetical protein